MIYNVANPRPVQILGILPALLAEAADNAVTVPTWLPGELIPGWTEDGTNVTFPIASLADNNLTAANADATTGDARAVISAFLSRFVEWNVELAAADRPTAIESEIRSRRLIKSGDYSGYDKQVYQVTAYIDYPEGTVAPEA